MEHFSLSRLYLVKLLSSKVVSVGLPTDDKYFILTKSFEHSIRKIDDIVNHILQAVKTNSNNITLFRIHRETKIRRVHVHRYTVLFNSVINVHVR